MDRTTLVDAIKSGPIRVRMNDGSEYIILSPEFCVVSEIAAHTLYKDDEGKLRPRTLALVCMVSIEPLESPARK
ncbi:MAG: hypothetical protein ABL921_22410 [Pirellula sp.]